MANAEANNSQRVQEDSQNSILECPICLQSCVHPVELPCSHIFCYLCIKGVFLQGPTGRCAICRQSIPHNVLTHPRLKDISQLYKDQGQGSSYQWYYEARGGGWWMYDVRTMQELERAYEAKQQTCQVLIAGQMYEIDFAQMIQYRVNNRSLFRRIKRDYSTAEKRGVAGIRLNQTGSGGQNSRNVQGGPVSSRRRGSPQVGTDNQRGPSSSSLPSNQLDDAAENSGRSDSDDEHNDEDSCSEPGDVEEDEEVEDEDDDDDMDLGEEEDADDSGSDCADECRDGARAPTRRSDRSNSSSNNQTSPPSTPSGSNGSTNCSSSPVDNKKACVHESTTPVEQQQCVDWRKPTSRSPKPPPVSEKKQEETVSSANSGGPVTRSRSRQSATPSPSNAGNGANNVQIGSIHLNSPINNNGSLTCILIGPSLRITIDYNSVTSSDEVL